MPPLTREEHQELRAGGAAVAAVMLALPSAAGAFVYWSTSGTGTIGRAGLDGASANQRFITGPTDPQGVAVDAGHIYWAQRPIGVPTSTGSNVDENFITGANNPDGVAVDGGHVYWVNTRGNTIGRANLDGTAANQSFIAGPSLPNGLSSTAITCTGSTAIGARSAELISAPAGIACGRTCAADFGHGARVSLRASASAGAMLRGWEGRVLGQFDMHGDDERRPDRARDVLRRASGQVHRHRGDQPPSAHRPFHVPCDRPHNRPSGLSVRALVSGGHRAPRFASCRSPRRYAHLAPGAYAFRVRASDGAGTDRSPSIRTFRIPGGRPQR